MKIKQYFNLLLVISPSFSSVYGMEKENHSIESELKELKENIPSYEMEQDQSDIGPLLQSNINNYTKLIDNMCKLNNLKNELESHYSHELSTSFIATANCRIGEMLDICKNFNTKLKELTTKTIDDSLPLTNDLISICNEIDILNKNSKKGAIANAINTKLEFVKKKAAGVETCFVKDYYNKLIENKDKK